MSEKITIQELTSPENIEDTVITSDSTTTTTVTVTGSSVDTETVTNVSETTEKKTRSRKSKKTETVSTTKEKAVSEATKEAVTSETAKQYKTGDVFDTRFELLYKSSLAPKHIKAIRGRFYVWSGEIVDNRIRLTDSPSGIGKINRIIGWVNINK